MKKGCLVYGMEMGLELKEGEDSRVGRLSLWISCLGGCEVRGVSVWGVSEH